MPKSKSYLVPLDFSRGSEVALNHAFALARENHIPIIVFSIAQANAISSALQGKGRSTIVAP